jgi:DNA-binding transcriptional ArsR family regulator
VTDPQLSSHDLALVDAVAHRVLELLAERDAPPGRSRLVSAGELAELLGVSRDTVYHHAEDLGAVRLGAGDGSRSEHGGRRLRFDVEQAIAAWTARQTSDRSQTTDPPAGPGHAGRQRQPTPGSDVPLLAVKGARRGQVAS